MKTLKVNLASVFAVLALFSLFFTSCFTDREVGTGSIISETRTVNSSFREIRIEGSMDCLIKQGDSVKVVAKDFANLLPLLETRVVGNTLVIKYQDNTWVSNGRGEVTVTVPQLTNIELSGSGNVGTVGNYRFDDVSFFISGSGNYSMAGSAKKVNAKISGSGDIKAFDMPCDSANVRISGSGDVEMSVNRLLDASITGSGDIVFKGNPTVNSSVTGSGRIRRF
jgi:hypothetical protein